MCRNIQHKGLSMSMLHMMERCIIPFANVGYNHERAAIKRPSYWSYKRLSSFSFKSLSYQVVVSVLL